MSGKKFLKEYTLKATYDVTLDGGTKNTAYTIASLPANALIVGGGLVTKTDFVGDATTISVGYTGAATAFLGATTATTMDANEVIKFLSGVPALGADADHDTAAEVATLEAAAQVYLTASKNVIVTLSNDNNLTAGKFDMYLNYIILK